MIETSNLHDLFKELDDQLGLNGEESQRLIVVYGGAALISMKIIDRATVDIDVFYPRIDLPLKRAISDVAKRHLFDENWVNSTGQAFVKELPDGWMGRTTIFYSGRYLTVKILGRSDLIFTKFLAELDRGDDLEDLKCLKPTKIELEAIEGALKALESDPSWSAKIEEIIKDLLGAK